MGRIIIIIIALFLLFGVFRDSIIEGIDTWRTEPTSENFLVTTGAGDDAENVTLSYDLYQAALAEVSSIESNNVTDTPVATAYDEDNKHLTVGGLGAGATRTLSIDYTAETNEETMRMIGPFLTVVILGGCIFFIFHISQKKHR